MDVFRPAPEEPGKFDLTSFNPDYFKTLERACRTLRELGVIVHLQLWQAVSWKKSWSDSYYHPNNNVNPELARAAAPGKFSTVASPELLAHQREYVQRLLDATAHLGNVYYDVMNEIGNGTAAEPAWVDRIIEFIEEWERLNGTDVLVTLNDEGGLRMGDHSLQHPGLDLVVKDLGRFDEHVSAQRMTGKPTVSVRNIEWNPINGKRTYFYGPRNLEATDDPALHSRGRRYWWRMLMAGVQLAGGYADAMRGHESRVRELLERVGLVESPGARRSTYRRTTETELVLDHLYEFLGRVEHYELLESARGISDHPAPRVYYLQSPHEAVIYLESHPGTAGRSYDRTLAVLTNLTLAAGTYRAVGLHTATGKFSDLGVVETRKGTAQITLPAFEDDYAVLLSPAHQG